MIIPNHHHSIVAVFSQKDDKGKSLPDHHEPIIAWDEDGNPLILGERSLVPADEASNFLRIEEGQNNIVGVIPGGGYRVKVKQHDGTLDDQMVLAWIIREDGATPLTKDDVLYSSQPIDSIIEPDGKEEILR